jgi:tRNA1(Val) A37 N6-methylase TrmN6
MVEVENYLLENQKLKIIQRKDMFNFSLDSVLLANFAFVSKKSKTIVDFGTNNGAIPLILSTKTKAHIIGIEIQEAAVALANKNMALNNLEKCVTIVHDDIQNYVKNSPKVDVVVCNPPFFKVSEHSNLNENASLTIARHEVKIDLATIIKSAATILENNGRLALIHRPERLMEIIALFKEYKIEPKRLRLVYPKKDMDAHMVLIEGRYQGKEGLKIEAPLIAHNQDGTYSAEVKQMFLGEQS